MSQGLCPSCGAAVNLTAGQNQTKCQYCQNTVTLQQAEAQLNEVKNSKIGGTLLIAETAQEGGSYEEALGYYNKIIEQEPTFAGAWLNKGICMVRTSTIGTLKFPEAISSWKNAIKFAKNPDAMKKRVALEINNVVSVFYPILESHFREFSSTTNAHKEHGARFDLLESALALALELNPTNKTIIENGIYLCDRFVESVRTTNYESDYGWNTGESLAEAIAPHTRSIKAKYEEALKRVDPAAFADKKGQEIIESKLKATKKWTVPLWWFIAVFGVIGIVLPFQEGSIGTNILGGVFFCGIAFGLFCLKVFIEERRKKQLQDQYSSPERQTQKEPATARTANSNQQSDPQRQTQRKPASPRTTEATQSSNPPRQAQGDQTAARTINAKRIPTALCAIFLGWLGIHKFMLGYTKEGVFHIILSVFWCIGGLIGLIEGVIYLTKSDEEYNKTYVQGKRRWF